MGESKKRSQATQDAVHKALNAFDAEIYEPRHKQATNEASTKRYLIEPFLLKVLGIDTRRPDHALMEVPAEGYRGGAADFVLLLDGSYWCVVEAKRLGAITQGARDALWKQLSHYANSATFREVNYFVLTDGRRWVWYRREPNKYLPETPFLEHEVTSPSSEAFTWCQAVKDLGSVDDLASAANEVRYTSASRKWLSGLKTPTDQTLESILGNEVFADLRGKGKRDLARARDALRSVWDAAFKEFVSVMHQSPPDPEPDVGLPSPEDRPAWRLGSNESWNSCESGADLMVAVIQALARRFTAGETEWYQLLAARWPKWIIGEGAEAPFKSWAGRNIDAGYSIQTGLSSTEKDQRLRALAADLGNRTGVDPQLEVYWPKSPRRPPKSIETQKTKTPPPSVSRKHFAQTQCAWRLGKKSDWNRCGSGHDLMEDVIHALAQYWPAGATDWYRKLASRDTKLVISRGSTPPFSSWAGRDLGDGYEVHVGMSNQNKEKRLRQLEEDIRARTGVDPQLELLWDVESGPGGAS